MNIFRKKTYNWPLILIVILAVILRIQGLNWDSGFHFHPDERMLIMVTEKIEFFSNLNPDFFNYGSLPIYILAGAAQILDTVLKTHFDTYDGLLLLGRSISTLMDLITIIILFRIAELLFKNKTIAAWSAFFYAVSFFPIQNSHFFIVDTFLNCFTTILVFLILTYRTAPKSRIWYVFLIGIVYAACLTTKVTALIFAPVILLSLALPHEMHENMFHRIWNVIMSRVRFHKRHFISLSNQILRIVVRIIIFSTSLLVFTSIFMPFAFIQWEQFLREILLQVQMNNNPYVFPYTLQYVDTTPYLYYLKNIFLWGLGPVISVFATMGILIGVVLSIKYRVSSIKLSNRTPSMIHTLYFILRTVYSPIFLFILFYLLFFLVIGKSAVKFMRYMLLMYPFFAIMAGYGVYQFTELVKKHSSRGTKITIIVGALLWTLSFLSIYSTPSTRIQATNWINAHIPPGAILAVEHWDDRVPIFDPGNYMYEELTLYDVPDNEIKWKTLNEKLARSDYIVIASNRLYTPLQLLQECDEHGRCYPMTKIYYEKLFSGELGFRKVAEFTAYPKLSIFNYQFSIIDDSADESFTVYDHPKIMIFEKM